MAARKIKRFEFESALWGSNCLRVAGVDEAGRGPLAGPVVAAAVILPPTWLVSNLPKALRGLNDSKQLTSEQRDDFYAFLIESTEIQYAVCSVDSTVIDTINILQATHCAMNQALAQLTPSPEHVLVDGLRVKSLRFPQTPIVQGDGKSYSIAAASVIAKVTRDRQANEWHRQWPEYGFTAHKGYGTPQHLEAIRTHGPCPIHRRSFAPIRPVVEQPQLL